MNKLEKLAEGVMSLKAQKEELQKVAEDYKAVVDNFEKRAMAEDILLRSSKAPNAPGKLRAANLEDFIMKRAQLEQSSFEYLEKISSMIDFLDEGDGMELSDYADNSQPRDFNEWLSGLDI